MFACLCVVFVFVASSVECSHPETAKRTHNPCGTWTPYKHEKCLKVIDSGLYDKESGGSKCHAFTEYFDTDFRLLRIQSEDEQSFVSHFLFDQLGIKDNVWLGYEVKQSGSGTRTEKVMDGLATKFTNWAETNKRAQEDGPCVQMFSGINGLAGQWTTTKCDALNKVVCERPLDTTSGSSQGQRNIEQTLLLLMSKLEKAEATIQSQEDKMKALNERIKTQDKTLGMLEEGLYLGKPVQDKPERDEETCGGDWFPYLDEKCVLIADKAGLQNRAEAERVCQSYGIDDHVPRVVTIKTKKEQDFLRQFLFSDHHIEDNAVLGLNSTSDDGVFVWNDGSDVLFSNWANPMKIPTNQSTTPTKRHCVQMESGHGYYGAGQWTLVGCKKKNVVVCERTRFWTLQKLQERFFNVKLQHEMQIEKLQESVPVGFIYIQLADQKPPTQLWPHVNWEDISPEYGNLVFRVLGNGTTSSGVTHEANAGQQLIVGSTHQSIVYGLQEMESEREIIVPDNGEWSDYVIQADAGLSSRTHLRFKTSAVGVHYPNQGLVRVWQRII